MLFRSKIIKNELAGIFNWVLEGLERLLTNKKFTYSKAANETLEEYRRNSDSVQLFIQEEGYQPSNDTYVIMKMLYSHYREFCITGGYKPLNKTHFRQRLEKLNVVIERKNRGYAVFLSSSTGS